MSNADKNNKITKINHKNIEIQIHHFINTWKMTQIYPIKTFIVIVVRENHFQITRITLDNDHPTIRIIEEDHHIKEIHESSHKNRFSRSHSRNKQNRNNYSKSNSNQSEFSFYASSHSNSRNRKYSSKNSSYNRYRNYSNERNRNYSNNRNPRYQNNNHAIILTTDQIITIIKIDHAIIHRIEIRVVTIDKETTLSHHQEITHVIKSHNKIIGVVHLNIESK